jgi:hypothetical protein
LGSASGYGRLLEILFMALPRLWIVVSATLLVFGLSPVTAAVPPVPTAVTRPDDAAALAATIDRYFQQEWARAGVKPAPHTDDAEFLRRVSFDIGGRLPTVAETRAFLADKRPDKRRREIEKLLAGPGYVNHFTNTWRARWMAEASTTYFGRFLIPGFEAWLRRELRQNTPYDQLVRKILTTPIGQSNVFDYFNGNSQELTPAGFYQAKEGKPENLAASTARMFLGVRLECAQCHDAKFASWTREQFWGLAAFFNGIQRQEQGDFVFPTRELNDRREIMIPGSDKVIQASYLDGKQVAWKEKTGARATLADWVTAPDNPYFARAAVNRLWAHFLGMGLTEPVDDMEGNETKAYHPELMKELSRQFIAHKYDLRFLIRAIASSQVYQLTSASPSQDPTRAHLFTHAPLRGLTPEQLFDSLALAIGYQDPQQNNQQFFFGDMSPRAMFLEKFASRSDKPTEPQTSILQALAIMNGAFINDATSVEKSEMLAAVADAPFLSTSERIETLYLATLSRKPTARELERLVKYIDPPAKRTFTVPVLTDSLTGRTKTPLSAANSKGREQRLADVFWALLNSSEFILNH